MTEKTFFLDLHGCAKNQVDSEIIITYLKDAGWVQQSEPGKAALIIIASCAFIESAKKESLDALMRSREAYPKARILLTGCLAERYAEALAKDAPEADGILGNGDLTLAARAAEATLRGERPVLLSPQKGVCSPRRSAFLSFRGSAYVKITEGCDNHCSFCAIPLIRGPLRSRKASNIVSEIKDLIARGVFEINLIGQDAASYGRGANDAEVSPGSESESPLCALLERISALEGTFWLRLLYMHPDRFDDAVLEVMVRDRRILPYFDIPFQSGDNGIIRAMNRRGTAGSYEALVKRIRKAFPDSALRTTFLTGFPGETEEAAEHTRAFLCAIQSDWSGCFTYSREEGTPAYSMKPQVPKRQAKRRADMLKALQERITQERLKTRLGRIYDVLIEEVIPPGEDGTAFAIGRPWFCAPEVDGAFVVKYTAEASSPAPVKEGDVIRARALSVNGVDIEALPAPRGGAAPSRPAFSGAKGEGAQ